MGTVVFTGVHMGAPRIRWFANIQTLYTKVLLYGFVMLFVTVIPDYPQSRTDNMSPVSCRVFDVNCITLTGR